MIYDFEGLSADLLAKLEKRLNSYNRAVSKDFAFALNIINDPKANENRPVIMMEMDNLLRDQVKKSQIFYTETFNKILRVLKDHLK